MKIVDKYDKLLIGLLPGLLLPVLTFIAMWLIIYDGTLGDYLRQFVALNRLSSLISLSALPNLLLFFIFIWMNRYRSARGVIFATIILALLMLVTKFTGST